MLSSLKHNLPPKMVDWLKSFIYLLSLFPNYMYDIVRYIYFSLFSSLVNDRENLRGVLIKNYHRLEKGMALPEPKRGFGKQVALQLVDRLEFYVSRYEWDDIAKVTLNVLDVYVRFHKDRGESVDNISRHVDLLLSNVPESLNCEKRGGTIDISRKTAEQISNFDFKSFSAFRFSTRVFSKEKPKRNQIESAIEIAIKTPSVCNRQPWRVYVFDDQERKDQLLKLQYGNHGFGSHASHLLIVTVDLRYFAGPNERNQAFVDGGLFAMSLAYGLHAEGLGACFLNWSADAIRDIKLHSAANIPLNQVIVTLIAVGCLPETLPVAQSPRRHLHDIMFWSK